MNMFFGTVEVFGCSVWRKFGTFFFGWTKKESIFSEINCIFRLFFGAFHFFGALIPNVQICWLLPRIKQRSFLAGCSDHKSDPGRPRG